MGKRDPGELLRELSTACVDANGVIERMQRLVQVVQCEIRAHELRVQANQGAMRLMIALSALVDEAGEKRDIFWGHGLVSREEYDALVWEFRRVGLPARLDGCKWGERDQAKKALLDIVREYREAYR